MEILFYSVSFCLPKSITNSFYFAFSIFGSCVFCAPLDRYIGRHIDRLSTDVSVDISGEYRSICRPTYRSTVGRYVDWDVSVDISTDTSVEHRSICRPRVIVRLSADMSIDRLPTFRRYFTATFPGCLAWNKVIHIASYHYLSTFWERCLLLPASQSILCINLA